MVAGQDRSRFLEFWIVQRRAALRQPNDLDQVVRRHRGARLAPEDVVEARERAALVVQAVKIEERVADFPAREAIDDQVKLVLGRAFRRRAVPGEDAVVEAMHRVDERHLELQAGRFFDADRFAETRHDRGFVLMHDEEERAPFQRGQEEDEPDDGEHGILHEADEAGGKVRTVNGGHDGYESLGVREVVILRREDLGPRVCGRVRLEARRSAMTIFWPSSR